MRFGSACQLLLLLLLNACLSRSCARDTAPGSGFDCCEGDILLLLDSSGSVSVYEFSHMLHFLAGLLRPFQVGRGHLRVALVQVATEPRVEFDFDAHGGRNALQDAILGTPQLRGDTKTHGALLLAQRLLRQPAGQEAPPRLLLWITDGVEPGNVAGPIAALRKEGVSVLAVSTGHTNYQVFRQAATPPIDKHLYFVDPDYMNIITTDLRAAITDLICGECLGVRDVTSHSAVLHWRPVLIGGRGQYELRYGHMDSYRKLILSADHTWIELTDLQPDTRYSVRLATHTRAHPSKTLSTTFTTMTDGDGVRVRPGPAACELDPGSGTGGSVPGGVWADPARRRALCDVIRVSEQRPAHRASPRHTLPRHHHRPALLRPGGGDLRQSLHSRGFPSSTRPSVDPHGRRRCESGLDDSGARGGASGLLGEVGDVIFILILVVTVPAGSDAVHRPHTPKPQHARLCVSRVQDSAWRRTVLHYTITHSCFMTREKLVVSRRRRRKRVWCVVCCEGQTSSMVHMILVFIL